MGNAQHQADSNTAPYNRATVGVITGIDMNDLPRTFAEMPVPITDAEKQSVRTAVGDYPTIAKEGGFREHPARLGRARDGALTSPGEPLRRPARAGA